jgi:hypothetical protein
MRAAFIAMLALGAAGCVLPEFKKVPTDAVADGGAQDGGGASEAACGLSDKLPKTCAACIRHNCCSLAKDCGAGTACGADLLKPIAPTTQVSSDFDALLGCMQTQCDDACNVTWGCVDKYTWPVPTKDYSFRVAVIDFAAEPTLPLPGVSVDACQSVDPTCKSGRTSHAVTDAKGDVTLTVPPAFDGFFSFSGGGYAPATTQWSEPIYRVANFTQFQLTSDALAALAVFAHVHKTITEPFDPNTGHVIFRVQGCLPVRYLDNTGLPHAEAADVKVTVSPNPDASRVFYTDKSSSVALALDRTSSSGIGGAFSLPTGNLSVSAMDTKSGREVATGTVQVQAGGVAFMYMLPTSAH